VSLSDHPLPLHDLRIVDCSTGLAAAFAAKLFAQYGADVIKIEPPTGDPMRQAGPFIDDEPGPNRSLLFNWLHAGQRSVALDLDTDPGLAALKQLLHGVDILIDSDPLAPTQARGLDQPALEDQFPNLITATVTPFGLTGPYAGYEATHAVLHALGGWVHPMGEQDRPPVPSGPELGLVMTGVFTAFGIMQALRFRPQVGGQAVDVSTQEVIAATMIYDTVSFQYIGLQRQRSGHALFNNIHNLGLHPSRDGYVGVYAPLSWQLRNLFEMMGKPELSDDERFRTPESRIAFADDLQQEIVAFTETQDSLEFYHAAQARRLPFNFHPTAEQIFDCLQMATGIRQAALPGRSNVAFNGRVDPRKAAFLAKFEAPAQGLTEFQSGIPQALTMMNGAMIADATDVTKSDLLIAVIDSPFMSTPQRVETLFLATLSRKPRDDERAKFVRYVESGGPNNDSSKALADVFWALLNSSEFILNH